MLAGPFSLVAVRIILSLQGRIKNVINDNGKNIEQGPCLANNMPWFMKLYIRDMISR